jgi:hypothetical protein
MYLRIIDSEITYPYSLQQFRVDNKTYTFPAVIPNETLSEFGVFEVSQTPKPNDYTKNISEGTPNLVDGVYYQNWVQTNASDSEKELRLAIKWSEIRELRNQLLSECDWTQLGDVTESIKTSYQSYRQDLRDITNQSDPFSIVWPEKP